MTVSHFKPEVWSRLLLEALRKRLVYGGPSVINRDYEGEIASAGDTVNITSIGDPTIRDYTQGSTIQWEDLQDAGQTLVIDQQKYFAFRVDDVDRRQVIGDMQTFVEGRANYKLADTADQFVANLYTGVATANTIGSTGSPVQPATYNPAAGAYADLYLKVLLPLGVKLDEANVPTEGRYCVLPPWADALVRQTPAFIEGVGAQGQPAEAFTTGFIGSVAGFNLFKSNNTPSPSAGLSIIQAGINAAITFADQIVEMEALRLQDVFGDGVRGLHVYGAKLARPDCIAVATVQRPAGI